MKWAGWAGASGDGRRVRAALAVGLVVGWSAAAACGGDDTGVARDTVDDADVGGFDTVAPEDTFVVADVFVPSEFLEPCRDNAECASGWCVTTADGALCTKSCVGGCPDGWDCVPVTNLGTDTVTICVDRSVTLCQPCFDDADCERFDPGSSNRCLDTGGGGAFCGQTCDPELRPCPVGYTCADAGDAAGQCVPDSGVCACNALGRELELETGCVATNEVGTCDGARVCGADGLTACDARVPAEETCNGVDDDCDGATDEGLLAGSPCLVVNEHGSCPGTAFCVGGQEECVGAPAREEVCDGFDDDCDGETDEGFTDTDDDGLADCVDPDMDGDGTPNNLDCAPLDPEIHRDAVEACDGVDNDCDGATDDEGAEGCDDYYRDVDGDGHGSEIVPPRCLCDPDTVAGYTIDDPDDADDCDDLNVLIYPGAPERCNGKDDDCDGDTDEGVQAPCGGCVNLCIVEGGPDTTLVFAPTAGNSVGVEVDGDGALRLIAGETSGTYRHVVAGWPESNTRWTVVFVDAALPGGGDTTLTVRHRGGADAATLAAAPWSASAGPYPPANFPLLIDVTAPLIEVELGLATSDVALTPLVRALDLLAESVP